MLAVKKLSISCRLNTPGTDANAHNEGETETEDEDIEEGIGHSGDQIMDGHRCCKKEQLFLSRSDAPKRPCYYKDSEINEQQRTQAENTVRGKREQIHVMRLIVL